MSREIHLRDQVVTAVPTQRMPEEVVFSLAGIIRASTSSPWTPRSKLYVTSIVTLLELPGTGASTISLRSNGDIIHPITMAADQTAKVDEVQLEIVPLEDILTVSVDAKGTGAPTGLTVILWFA